MAGLGLRSASARGWFAAGSLSGLVPGAARPPPLTWGAAIRRHVTSAPWTARSGAHHHSAKRTSPAVLYRCCTSRYFCCTSAVRPYGRRCELNAAGRRRASPPVPARGRAVGLGKARPAPLGSAGTRPGKPRARVPLCIF